MFLALDIGNSKTKWGLFENGNLSSRGVFLNSAEIPVFWNSIPISGIVHSSSGKIGGNLRSFINCHPQSLDLNSLPLPFESHYETPDTLGRDRVAAIKGGLAKFKNSDLLVIDAGTCITYDFIDKNGSHLGGTISPGIKMRLKAVNAFTDKLPLLSEMPDSVEPIAKNTNSAIGQGALVGVLYETEGYISYVKSLFPKVKILVTGGDAWIFVKFIKIEIFAEPNLVLMGLNEILKNYVEEKGWN